MDTYGTVKCIESWLWQIFTPSDVPDIAREFGIPESPTINLSECIQLLSQIMYNACSDIHLYLPVLYEIISAGTLLSLVSTLPILPNSTSSHVIRQLVYSPECRQMVYVIHERGIPMDMFDPCKHRLILNVQDRYTVAHGVNLDNKFESTYGDHYVVPFEVRWPPGGWRVPDEQFIELKTWEYSCDSSLARTRWSLW